MQHLTEERKICPTCGGSGQISFFAGASRFLLTTEECPACFGTGFEQPDSGPRQEQDPAAPGDESAADP